MADELLLQMHPSQTGLTTQAVLYDNSGAPLATVALSDLSNGIYVADMPGAIPAGRVLVQYEQDLGGAAGTQYLGHDNFWWTGSARMEDLVITNVDAQISSLQTEAAADLRHTDQLAQHGQTQADIAALNNPSSADIATAVWGAASRTLTSLAGLTFDAAALNDISTAVEAALLNEGDGQLLLDAIVQKINSDLDVNAIELAAIATAVRSELATELARIDVPVSDLETEADAATRQTALLAAITAASFDETTILQNQAVLNNGIRDASLRVPHLAALVDDGS